MVRFSLERFSFYNTFRFKVYFVKSFFGDESIVQKNHWQYIEQKQSEGFTFISKSTIFDLLVEIYYITNSYVSFDTNVMSVLSEQVGMPLFVEALKQKETVVVDKEANNLLIWNTSTLLDGYLIGNKVFIIDCTYNQLCDFDTANEKLLPKYYFDKRSKAGFNYNRISVGKWAGEILAKKTIVGFNVKYDVLLGYVDQGIPYSKVKCCMEYVYMTTQGYAQTYNSDYADEIHSKQRFGYTSLAGTTERIIGYKREKDIRDDFINAPITFHIKETHVLYLFEDLIFIPTIYKSLVDSAVSLSMTSMNNNNKLHEKAMFTFPGGLLEIVDTLNTAFADIERRPIEVDLDEFAKTRDGLARKIVEPLDNLDNFYHKKIEQLDYDIENVNVQKVLRYKNKQRENAVEYKADSIFGGELRTQHLTSKAAAKRLVNRDNIPWGSEDFIKKFCTVSGIFLPTKIPGVVALQNIYGDIFGVDGKDLNTKLTLGEKEIEKCLEEIIPEETREFLLLYTSYAKFKGLLEKYGDSFLIKHLDSVLKCTYTTYNPIGNANYRMKSFSNDKSVQINMLQIANIDLDGRESAIKRMFYYMDCDNNERPKILQLDLVGAELGIMIAKAGDTENAHKYTHDYLGTAFYRIINQYMYNETGNPKYKELYDNFVIDSKRKLGMVERKKVKNCDFAIPYGAGVGRVAITMSVKDEIAKQIIAVEKQELAPAFTLLDETQRTVEKDGFLVVCPRTNARIWSKEIMDFKNKGWTGKSLYYMSKPFRNYTISGVQAIMIAEMIAWFHLYRKSKNFSDYELAIVFVVYDEISILIHEKWLPENGLKLNYYDDEGNYREESVIEFFPNIMNMITKRYGLPLTAEGNIKNYWHK